MSAVMPKSITAQRFALSLLLVTVLVSYGCAAGCDQCLRRAALVEFVNVHAPQYEDQLKEWNECMLREFGPITTFDPDHPGLKQALQKCAGIDPGGIDYMWPSSVMSWLAWTLGTDCFHMTFMGNPHPPEYLFKGSFDAGITGVTNDRGREIKSRFIIKLYYNGSPEELMKTWTTDSTLTSVNSQTNRMFKNRDAAIREEKPIEKLLWDFERRPATCRIDMHGDDWVKPGEEVEIEVTDFKDSQGRDSKPFNRIVVQAKEGTILSGAALGVDKDLKAFSIASGSVTIKYKAPNDSEVSEDMIWINNSCEILPEGMYPMSKTELGKEIAEQKVLIGDVITARIVETSSGQLGQGEDSYPFSYKVSMEFAGPVERIGGVDEKTAGGKEAVDQIAKLIEQAVMPPVIRKLAGEKEAKLLASLLPVESSMKVDNWHCTDPMNNAPPPARFPRIAAEAHIPGAAAQAWVIGDKVYIVQGFLDGILGYFPSWEESGNKEQPLGARVDATWEGMGEYLELSLDRLLKEKTLIIKKENAGTDGDAWSWKTSWMITISN